MVSKKYIYAKCFLRVFNRQVQNTGTLVFKGKVVMCFYALNYKTHYLT